MLYSNSCTMYFTCVCHHYLLFLNATRLIPFIFHINICLFIIISFSAPMNFLKVVYRSMGVILFIG